MTVFAQHPEAIILGWLLCRLQLLTGKLQYYTMYHYNIMILMHCPISPTVCGFGVGKQTESHSPIWNQF